MLNSNTRSFQAHYPIFLDDAIIAQAAHQITAIGYGATIQFQIDGQPATLQQVADVRALAESRGTFKRISGPDMLPIGKARAHQMHVELARKGYPAAHYDLASGVLGREVASFAALTEPEARTVWTALIYGAGVAA